MTERGGMAVMQADEAVRRAEEAQDVGPFSCPREDCAREFGSRHALRVHLSRGHPPSMGAAVKARTCPVCNYLFSTPHALRGHIRTQHPERAQEPESAPTKSKKPAPQSEPAGSLLDAYREVARAARAHLGDSAGLDITLREALEGPAPVLDLVLALKRVDELEGRS